MAGRLSCSRGELSNSQSEGGILLGFRRHGDLPKPRVHIERGVVGSSHEAFQHLTDAGEGVGILYS